MYSNYFFRMPMYPMMNNTIGENSMMGMPPIEEENTRVVEGPTPGFGTGGPDFVIEPGPPVQDDVNYTQGYLKTHIGDYAKIEFLIGTNLFIDKEGVLKDVGISYVVIEEAGTGHELLADIYSIKFVTFYDGNGPGR